MSEEQERLTKLWASVFVQGIRDYAAARKNEDDRGTIYWFERDERVEPGSFLWLCELFGYEPSYVRSHVLMNMRKIIRDAEYQDAKELRRDSGRDSGLRPEPIPAGHRADTQCARGGAAPETGWGEPDDDVLREAFPEGLQVSEEIG